MVIDRERVKQAFQEYTGRYDIHDEKIRLKVEHTYRVADISEQIAEKLGLSEEDIALAWLIGMLHDIGRFEQLRRFHTFVDSQSIDHSHFGVELLFQDGLLARFVDNSSENEELIKKAIFRDTKKVPIDNLAGHIALVFELEFPQSYEIVKEQGYLDRLLAFQSPNEGLMLQFQEMRQIMQEHLQAMAEKNRQTV